MTALAYLGALFTFSLVLLLNLVICIPHALLINALTPRTSPIAWQKAVVFIGNFVSSALVKLVGVWLLLLLCQWLEVTPAYGMLILPALLEHVNDERRLGIARARLHAAESSAEQIQATRSCAFESGCLWGNYVGLVAGGVVFFRGANWFW